MFMKTCSNCKKTPSFIAVTTAINPVEFKCNHCQNVISVKLQHALLVLFFGSLLCLLTLIGLKEINMQNITIYGIFALEIVVLAIVYYYLVINGIISTSLE